MRVSEGEKVVAFSLVEHDDEEELATVEAPDAEGNSTEAEPSDDE